MLIHDQKAAVVGSTYIGIGSGVAWVAHGYELGTSAEMGPGYVPFFAGIGLCLVGAAAVLGASRDSGRRTSIGKIEWGIPVVVLASVALFGILTEQFGVLASVPALLALSAVAHPERSLRYILLSIIVLLPLTWLVFIKLLGIPLKLLDLG